MVYSVNDQGEIVKNSIVDIKEHLVEEYYNIVPRYWAIDATGVISSKRPIKVTENNSLMCYDEQEKQIVLKRVSEYLQEPARYYMIIRGPETDLNNSVKISTPYGIEANVKLDYVTGFMLAVYLKQQAGIENIINSQLSEYIDVYEEDWSEWFEVEYDFYKKTYNSSLSSIKLVNIKNDTPFKILADTVIARNSQDKYTVVNEIFYSSNTNFIVGFLEALINTEKCMVHEIGETIIPEALNPSVYTNCLNILFANYSITKAAYLKYPHDYSYSIKFDVSPEKYDKFRVSQKKVKKHYYTRILGPDGSVVIDTWNQISRYSVDDAANETIKGLMRLKAEDKIKFIRLDECIVSPVRTSEPVSLYDLTTGYGNATNYLLSCLPFSKNSDGDVLAVMAIMTEEALKAADKIMMSNADRLKDGVDPDKIRNWIQKDAVVGLYQATKDA